jgi:hypothetical protein
MASRTPALSTGYLLENCPVEGVTRKASKTPALSTGYLLENCPVGVKYGQ